MIRWLPAVLLLALGGAPHAGAQPAKSLFESVRPDVSIVVREHPTSAEIVRVTALDADYPPELLQRQAAQIGQNTGSPARGVHLESELLDPANERLRFLSVSFATDHLIERSAGILRLEPIVRAFADANSPRPVKGLSIIFDAEVPNEKIVRTYSSDTVAVEGRATQNPPGIEYRVLLKSQDPAQIRIPENAKEPAEISPTPRTNRPSTTVLIALGALAAIAAGALVYLALLRTPGEGKK